MDLLTLQNSLDYFNTFLEKQKYYKNSLSLEREKYLIKSNSLEELKKNLSLVEKSIDFFLRLIQELTTTQLDSLSIAITDALNIVFPNRNYRLKISIEDSRGVNQILFNLYKTLDDGSEVVLNMDEIGTGVRSVVSFIFQLFFLKKIGSYPFVVYDEQFTEIHSEFMDNFFDLLKDLNQKYGFDFLLISQDPRIFERCDYYYLVKDGKVSLKGKSDEQQT